MKNNSIPLSKKLCFVLCTLIIPTCIIIGMAIADSQKSPAGSAETLKGLSCLEKMEKNDPAVAEEFHRTRTKEYLESEQTKLEREKLIDDINNDRVDVFSLFKDYAILGDSRAHGFSYFKFLSYSRVLADGGDTIRNVRTHMDKLKNLAPTYIYLCYGLNDAGIGYWKTPEEYADEVLQIINELREALPDAKIYYNSIIWISDGAASYAPWAQIYDYSSECRKMCEENGIYYIDNDEICMQLKPNKWWSGDGVHVCKPFYKLWAKNLYLATLED